MRAHVDCRDYVDDWLTGCNNTSARPSASYQVPGKEGPWNFHDSCLWLNTIAVAILPLRQSIKLVNHFVNASHCTLV